MSTSRIHAPALPDNLEWFNTDDPIRLAEQTGKVVLLDFWTYSCVNCMHVLDDLAWLERKYGDRLLVIGVHSPKFPNERVGEHVAKAINRHYVRHPVVNDPELRLWKKYAIKAWPSIIFIDPEGYIVGVLRGEGRRKQLDQMIDKALRDADAKKLRAASNFTTTFRAEHGTQVKFPGNVLATRNKLYIADTGHNRILECMHNGRILRSYGSGTPGLVDGEPHECSFNAPQGMCRVGEYLFVADTGNHVVRKIDLTTYEVSSAVGNGVQGSESNKSWRDPLQATLNSPWDIAYHNRCLYIAMAGSHQIWQWNMSSEEVSVYSGTGSEGIVDGSAVYATYAQPTSIAVGEDVEPVLFVADAESSAIRALRFRDQHIRTLVGKGLFEFGDIDGRLADARLQHPMGVSYDPQRNSLWLVDTYNHKIKILNLVQQKIATLKIEYKLSEPTGLSVSGNTLFVANTNAHQILAVDLTDNSVGEVEVFSVEND